MLKHGCVNSFLIQICLLVLLLFHKLITYFVPSPIHNPQTPGPSQAQPTPSTHQNTQSFSTQQNLNSYVPEYQANKSGRGRGR